jgi:hypothetical protein
MSGSDQYLSPSAGNSLHRLASAGAILLGVFLLAGASGHFAAVWPTLQSGMTASGSGRLALLLPGLMLMTTGLINIALCRALWTGTVWAQQLALLFNGITAVYLAYLLHSGVPDHPIGLFLAVVCSDLIVLGALRMGLVWPAADASSVRR